MSDSEFEEYIKRFRIDQLAPEYRVDGRKLVNILRNAHWSLVRTRRMLVFGSQNKNRERFKEAEREFEECKRFVENHYLWGMLSS